MHEEYGTEIDYFSRLDLTLLTLAQLTTLDGWVGVARHVVGIYSWAWVPILSFITLTGIFVMNIVIAVICESTLDSSKEKSSESQNQEEQKERNFFDLKMKQIQEATMALKDEIERGYLNLSHNGGPQELVNSVPMSSLASQSSILDSSSFRQDSHSPYASHDVIELISTERSSSSEREIKLPSIEEEENRAPLSLQQRRSELREKCGALVNSKPMDVFIITSIIVNSILMAIGTFSFVKDNPSTLAAFGTANTVFLCIYTVESFLQVVYHGPYIYKDSWASFDLFLVVLSWSFLFANNIPIQSARSLRTIRILRLVPKLKSLKAIIVAVGRVLPKVGGIAGILFLFQYIFTILMTVLFKDIELSDNFFSGLDTTLFTLFQIMTMVDWTPLARELMEHVVWAPLLILIYLVLSNFILLNLIVALLCEAMTEIESMMRDKEEGLAKDADELDHDMGHSVSNNRDPLSFMYQLECIAQTQKEIHILLQQSSTISPSKFSNK